MAREKRYTEKMIARFEVGTFDAIDSVKSAREDRTEFVRIAVDKEIAWRKPVPVAESDFGKKLNKVMEIIQRAGRDGMSRTELTKGTQRILGGTRERDDILDNLKEAGVVVVRNTSTDNTKPKPHYWCADHAPQEDEGGGE